MKSDGAAEVSFRRTNWLAVAGRQPHLCKSFSSMSEIKAVAKGGAEPNTARNICRVYHVWSCIC